MIQTQYINLNIVPSGVMPVLYCSQYDIGRPLGMVVYNGGEAVDLTGYACMVEATRTDGTAITAGVTTSGNIGAFITTATMTNQADRYSAKLVLFDSNNRRVASLAFVMVVTARTMDENAEEIEEDASLFQQYTGTVQALIAGIRADLAAETERANAADAVLSNDIAAETAARQAADTTLTNNLSAEAVARQTADTTLANNLSAEASTRATTDASLQSQIDQLIAPTGEAPSAAEVENARIGADGTNYTTLGDAIRTQVDNLQNGIDGMSPVTYGWTLQQNVDATGRIVSSIYTALSAMIPCSGGDTIIRKGAPNDGTYAFVCYVNQYVGNTWKSRTSIGRNTPFVLDSDVTNVRIGFGRGSSSGVTISQADIDNYFDMDFIRKLAVDSKALQMRGNIIALGYTSLGQCTDPGAYVFSSEAAANTITDLPSDFPESTGGMVITYNQNGAAWQNLICATKSYIRYGFTASWTNLKDNVMLPRGNIINQGFTSFGQCTEPGAYIFTTSDLASITDAPDGLNSGGVLWVYAKTTSTVVWQELHTLTLSYIRYGTASAWSRLTDAIRVTYSSPGIGSDNSIAQIDVDIPKGMTRLGVRYRMGHCVNADNNADVWRLVHVYRLSIRGVETIMTRSGECECALRLANRDDFSGGIIHGDEVDQNVTFFVDGIQKSASEVTGFCKEFRIVRNSILYDPADSTTPIAEHGCEYIYTLDGLTINQSIKWLISASLAACYLAMYPILKTYSGYRYDDTSYAVTANTTTDYSVSIPSAKSVTEFNAEIASTVEIPVYPSGLTGGDRAVITDNGGGGYNKIYFVICTGGTSTVGELWKSTTVYKII